MKCPTCKKEMIHSGDVDFNDLGLEEDGIVHMHICQKCDTNVEVSVPEAANRFRVDDKDAE